MQIVGPCKNVRRGATRVAAIVRVWRKPASEKRQAKVVVEAGEFRKGKRLALALTDAELSRIVARATELGFRLG